MRKFVAVAGIAVLASLGGCASGGLFDRESPDEFAVSRQAPLVVPPDFALVPPQPGAAIGVDDAQQEALEALFGGDAPRSETETAIVGQAGGARSDAGIRSTVGDPDTVSVNKGTVTSDIIAAPEGAGRDATADTPTAGTTPPPKPN